MSLIVLCSASGSPGVTTAALGLALTWPRPVLLVEADPTGGSAVLAGYFRGQVTPPGTMLDLAFAHRTGTLTDAIPRLAMRIPDTDVTFLPGLLSHGQARSVEALWEPLAAALTSMNSLGQDVLVDAGRLGLTGSPEPLLNAADLCLLVSRTDLVSLAGARSWAQTLRTGFEERGAGGALALLPVGPGRPYTPREVAKVLRVPVLASLAWDEPGAAVFSRGAPRPRRWERSPLPTSLRAAGDAARTRIGRAIADLQPGSAGSGPDAGHIPAGERA
ncbi:hypothetical protein [Phycicoccus flavus]|uniref:hypothetical protein n=1 Tax=Phycicoccus flavus TaxID=2502783 RepID=UPI00197B6603|nr:hypothetical protein [Phycicoccus flavus]